MREPLIAAFAAAALAFAANASQAATVGQAAPGFTAKDSTGKTVNLADFKGKTVVLEWNNPECPFVKKHYDSANMQGLQSKAGQDNIVWLSVNSTHPSHQDYKKPDALNSWVKGAKASPTAYLMDEEGTLGKTYAAKTTPHMYVINPQGTLVYAGAIDDNKSANPADVKTAKNYLAAALGDLKAGKPVATPSTTPYGCSVKYKS